MKRVVRWCLVMLLPLIAATPLLAADYMEGGEYLKLENPQPTASKEKIEVVELFWYGCPHCYRLEPYLKDWSANMPEDVQFIRLPAILGPGWELLAKAWFTAELLGVTDKTHTALFEEIHVRKKRINSEEDLRELFVKHGVSPEDFDKTFRSFAVAIKLNNARLMTRRYAITGVPTVIINGKYSTSASIAGGNAELVSVMNYLIGQERKQAAMAGDEPAVTTATQ
ncbi:MAG: thiol:disulfide interchange protein DsbA/DsbL [Gammaproteobacteria bacterium]